MHACIHTIYLHMWVCYLVELVLSARDYAVGRAAGAGAGVLAHLQHEEAVLEQLLVLAEVGGPADALPLQGHDEGHTDSSALLPATDPSAAAVGALLRLLLAEGGCDGGGELVAEG
jgi:hypothetical protein